jgi:mannose-6-phosphate isomerase
LSPAADRPRIARLEPAIQHYDWGSRRVLAELRGECVPSERPEAELWFGAHPRGEARVVSGASDTQGLAAWIDADPAGVLGAAIAARHGARLPFLLKLLAVERALSLQAHPDAAQARAGFEREERARVPAAERLYADRNAKPELVVALSPFRALCGFRPLDEIRARFAGAGIAELAPPADAEPEKWLRGFLAEWLAGDASSDPLVRAVAAARRNASLAWVARLADQHPGDPGAIAPLLLNEVELAPGEGLFLEAGELHCYLEGAAVEIMGASDNVLRAGLTTKPRAVAELMRIGRFAPRAVPRVATRATAPGVRVYETPAAEFELARIDVGRGGSALDAGGAVALLLCCAGGVRVAATDAGGAAVVLRRGQGCVVPADVGAVRLDGAGVLYRAAPARGSRGASSSARGAPIR